MLLNNDFQRSRNTKLFLLILVQTEACIWKLETVVNCLGQNGDNNFWLDAYILQMFSASSDMSNLT